MSENIPVGKFVQINNRKDLITEAEKLGWPENKIVVKPPSSNGSRGVRIIDESINQKDMFFNEKPTSLYTSLRNLKNLLGNKFPVLILTEFLPGIEYTVDIFNNTPVIAIPRKREQIKSGITFRAVLEQKKEIINFSKKLTDVLNLDFCVGLQFKMDEKNVPKILECNPRVQGTMVLSTLAGANIIYSSVKKVMGEKIPEFDINWGTSFIRYWGGVSINNK